MVGFNPDAASRGRSAITVFTFHYGRIQSRDLPDDLHRLQIYIPLWSDSIEMCVRLVTGQTRFTFHYGRIQSVTIHCSIARLSYLHSIMVGFNRSTAWLPPRSGVFTFHYGRIQSLKAERVRNRVIVIYIPLWSDSIAESGGDPNAINLIYIPLWSDSICRRRARPAVLRDLHSIMVGFNHA